MNRCVERMLIIIFITVVVSACIGDRSGYRYDVGNLPDKPENLSEFNSPYDDYNSTAPSLGKLVPFCFSTNRKSQGSEFDVIYMPMNVDFNRTSGILQVTDQYDSWQVLRPGYETIRKGVAKIRTDGNEFGPNLIVDYEQDRYSFTLLYSTDITGNSQIKFVSNKTQESFSEPEEVRFLNSEFDDMYPAFNEDYSKIYFCSDRGGNGFDIYYVDVDDGTDLESLLADKSTGEILRDGLLSSGSNDKCPFLLGDKIVFASDRPGGFGGYDLYYSDFVSGEWTEPINFGNTINTDQDEFRPILIDEGVSSSQTMMVFSSNRPGGLGGFDLYYVGIENK